MKSLKSIELQTKNQMKILIVIPAYNEEKILESNILKIVDFCRANLKIDWQIVIADNKSTDRTPIIAKKLVEQVSNVDYLYVDLKGKGAAIKQAWQNFQSEIYCFMDADLATDLSALPVLIAEIINGNDLVVGSRFHPQSKYDRSVFRKLFSLGYKIVLKLFLNLGLSDAPCGFKAVNDKVKREILPLVKDNEWFFDSELLILAKKKGYQVKEIPVIWADLREGEDKSKVKIISLSYSYFRKVLAMRKRS